MPADDLTLLLEGYEARTQSTQGQAAKSLGVSRSTYTAWRSGAHSPPLGRAARLAEQLGAAEEEVVRALLARQGKQVEPEVDIECAADYRMAVAAGGVVDSEECWNSWRTAWHQRYRWAFVRGAIHRQATMRAAVHAEGVCQAAGFKGDGALRGSLAEMPRATQGLSELERALLRGATQDRGNK